MAKPSTKKKSTTKRRKRPATVAPGTAPEVTATEGITEAAASQPETAAVDQEPPAPPEEDGEEGADGEQSPEVNDSAGPVPSEEVEEVQFGGARGRRQRVPVDIVCGILGREALSRVEVLRGESSIDSVQKRMLATDGRATPVVFAAGRAENEAPSIIGGLEAVAAALNCGATHLSVIIVPSGEVGSAQSHIVEMMRKQQQPDDPEDDLYVRVLADD